MIRRWNNGINYEKADVGVSTSGINDLEKQVLKEVLEATQVCSVNSKEYKTLVTSIRQYWSGEDCNNYIADLNQAVKDLNDAIGYINTSIKNGLEKYKSEFSSFQQSNYKKVPQKLNK